mmetsp:Transcript_10363/g.27486  ORF Transcript_10363/g.27486 Transcript_10363/m.27486 type:complete len:323 (-) Transcript_10363:84-1052(-)
MASTRQVDRSLRHAFLLAAAGAAAYCGAQSFALLWAPKAMTSLRTVSALTGSGAALQGLKPAVSLAAVADSGTAPAPFDLTGKVALVTGASRGIGAAIAKKLADAGATVVGTATSDSGAEAISARFVGDLKGKGMKLNVGSNEEVDAVFKTIADEYGVPDILVNNAGITQDTLMMRMKETQWDAVIDTNLNSVFRTTKVAIKGMMKKRWGRVISISSVVGSMGNMGQANYAASKAGMEGFSRALAREVASRGITVNTVAPGFIATDMTDGLKEEWKEKLLESVPVGRLGTPDEIADAVLFLAAPGAGYITGQNLHVNGGMYM